MASKRKQPKKAPDLSDIPVVDCPTLEEIRQPEADSPAFAKAAKAHQEEVAGEPS